MKRIFIWIISIVMLISMTGCGDTLQESKKSNTSSQTYLNTQGEYPDILNVESDNDILHTAQYIRTNGYIEGENYPKIALIHNTTELNKYYEDNRQKYGLGHNPDPASDYTIGFLDAVQTYNDTFFDQNFLILVLLEEGSGSISHEVYGVKQTADKKLSISIVRNVPEAGTCDMAQWHIILELSKEFAVASTDDILVYLDGDLAWDRGIVEPSKPEAEFKEPPKGTLHTNDGNEVLCRGGYNWSYRTKDGIIASAITDQAGRPLPKEYLSPVILDSKFAETVYAPIPGSTTYAPTNSLGWLVKLSWESEPTSISYTCWPDKIWQDSNTPEEDVISQENTFYAEPGSYIYEITATWDNPDLGYWGTANYYVYIEAYPPAQIS